jgi:ADP-ribosyl-[dinitrogen reductase] hydrolase
MLKPQIAWGVLRPMVLAMLVESAYQGLGFAIEHQCLTHRSENAASALGILVPLLNSLVNGADPVEAISVHAKLIRMPHIPGNIAKDEMWRLHMRLDDAPYEVVQFARQYTEREVIRHVLATACYPEHGLPLLLYLIMKHDLGVEDSLLANANAGGDGVHRGMIMGLIAGAANDDLPEHLINKLVARDELKVEIDAFVDVALRGNAI